MKFKIILILILVASISFAVFKLYMYEDKRTTVIQNLENRIFVIERFLIVDYYYGNSKHRQQPIEPKIKCQTESL